MIKLPPRVLGNSGQSRVHPSDGLSAVSRPVSIGSSVGSVSWPTCPCQVGDDLSVQESRSVLVNLTSRCPTGLAAPSAT